MLFRIFLMRFRPDINRQLQFTSLQFSFLTGLFNGATNVNNNSFRVPLTVKVRHISNRVQATSVHKVRQLITLHVVRGVTFKVVEMNDYNVIVISTKPLQLPGLRLGTNFPLGFRRFPRYFKEIRVVRHQHSSSADLVIVIINRVGRVLLGRLRHTLTSRHSKRIRVLATLRFILSNMFRNPAIVINSRHQLMLYISVILFISRAK